jgi:uncharacterized membrane protein
VVGVVECRVVASVLQVRIIITTLLVVGTMLLAALVAVVATAVDGGTLAMAVREVDMQLNMVLFVTGSCASKLDALHSVRL